MWSVKTNSALAAKKTKKAIIFSIEVYNLIRILASLSPKIRFNVISQISKICCIKGIII